MFNFENIIKKIKKTSLSEKPYKHLCIENLFEENEYNQILKNLPQDDSWEGVDENLRRKSWQNQVFIFNHNKIAITKSVSMFFESDKFLNLLQDKYHLQVQQ